MHRWYDDDDDDDDDSGGSGEVNLKYSIGTYTGFDRPKIGLSDSLFLTQ
jgi:hypothetical protein